MQDVFHPLYEAVLGKMDRRIWTFLAIARLWRHSGSCSWGGFVCCGQWTSRISGGFFNRCLHPTWQVRIASSPSAANSNITPLRASGSAWEQAFGFLGAHGTNGQTRVMWLAPEHLKMHCQLCSATCKMTDWVEYSRIPMYGSFFQNGILDPECN